MKNTKYFDKKTSILNKIRENNQKIAFISLNPIDYNEHLHITHLRRENVTLSKFYVVSSGLHAIWFLTSGIIKYSIKCDPYSTDLIGVFYICLGVATTIGIISYAYKFRKLVKMKPISEKEIIMCN